MQKIQVTIPDDFVEALRTLRDDIEPAARYENGWKLMQSYIEGMYKKFRYNE